MILPDPSPRELAREALEALSAARMTPEEHFEFLVREGIIDRTGKVLCNRLFGDEDEEVPVAPKNGTGTASDSHKP